MPKPPKISARAISLLPANNFVLDNGGYSIKAGFAPTLISSERDVLQQCHTVPNSLARTRDRRTYVATQQEHILQWSEVIFRRPIEHGQLVNWEAEKEIWDHSFFDGKTAHKDLHIKDPSDTTLILTEAPNTIQALQRNADEIIMEEWGFGGYAKVVGPSLNAYHDLHSLFGDVEVAQSSTAPAQPVECLLVIDSGYSHTLITPLYNGRPIQRAIRRLELGGKHLTNLLKEAISVRYFDLHQDTKIVNDIKEDVCYVSSNFSNDMEKTWKGNSGKRRKSESNPLPAEATVANSDDAMDLDRPTHPPLPPSDRSADATPLIDYILPDGFRIKRGFSRPHDPVARKREKQTEDSSSVPAHHDDEVSMTLGSERFSVPEILFTPSDVGSRQPGIAEAVMQSLAVLPPALQTTLLANILVVGGNARMKGLVQRIYDEIRMLAPVEYEVRVRMMEDPVTSTWLGGAKMAGNREVVREIGVSREEYGEFGPVWVGRKLAGLER